MLDLSAPARQVTALVVGVGDDQLSRTTPCPAYRVGELLDHIRGLAIEFTNAATKSNRPPSAGGLAEPPQPSADRLPADWRDDIASQLAALAGAWQLPDAWEGDATAGGTTWPAQVMGLVAFNEVVIHGWDLAVSTGQAYQPDAATLQICHDFLLPSVDDPEARGEIYGPVVPVPDDALLLDRVLGLAGRDPAWKP